VRVNHYPKHIGDYIRDTIGLSMLEDGAYNRLMDQAYATEGPLPADKSELYRLARAATSAEKKAVDYVISRYFTLTETGWVQARVQKELVLYAERAERSRQNGKSGGRPRKPEETQKKPSGFSTGNPGSAQAKTNHKPEPKTINQETTPKAPADAGLSAAPTANDEPPFELAADCATPRPSGRVSAVKLVFDYWRITHSHPQAQLGDSSSKRHRAIDGRLKDGYTVDQLKLAIDGCKNSPHHMGENDRSTVYDDIELICRDGAHVDKFIRLAGENPARLNLSSAGRQTASNVDRWLETYGLENARATG